MLIMGPMRLASGDTKCPNKGGLGLGVKVTPGD
jgi:hypothetical protein